MKEVVGTENIGQIVLRQKKNHHPTTRDYAAYCERGPMRHPSRKKKGLVAGSRMEFSRDTPMHYGSRGEGSWLEGWYKISL